MATTSRPWLASARALIALLASLLALSIAHAQRQSCEFEGRPVNLDNGSTTAGLTGLIRCRDRDSGRLAREMEIRQGVFIGIERFFEASGERRERTINDRGNTEGWARQYDSAGKLREETFHRDGTRVGLARRFHPDGSVRSLSVADDQGREQAKAEFNARGQLSDFRCAATALIEGDAQRCGFAGASEVETFREDGSRASLQRWEAGRLSAGSWFGRDGVVQRSEVISGNERTQRSHHPSGTVRREQVSDLSRRQRIAEREFSESGTRLSEILWRDGQRALDASWYQNGQPRERNTWLQEGGRRIAQQERFDDSGARVFSGSRDERGRSLGVHRHFDGKGNLRLEQHFDDSGRLTRRREWEDGGRLVTDDELFPDGSRKAYSR